MRWKVTLQFLIAIIIIGIATNFINTVVMSYYFYIASDGSNPGKMMIAFAPDTLDVKRVVTQIRIRNDQPVIAPEAVDMLNKSKGWIQIIDNSGKEIKSLNTPIVAKKQYTDDDLERLKELPGLMKGYDIFIYQSSTAVGSGLIGKASGESYVQVMKGNREMATEVNGIAEEGVVQNVRYIVGVPKPKITVYTFLYSFYSYIKDFFNLSPQNGPRGISNLLTLIIIVMLGYVFARKLTKPVVKITDGIAAMSEGDYSISYPEKGLYREVYNSLNHMSQTLQSNEQGRKRNEKMREEWIANISHDLKTPLSSIRGYMELMLETDSQLTPEERRKFSQIIIDKSDYMEILLEDLKLTQKLKNELIPLNKTEVNIVEILRDVVISILNNPRYQDRKVVFEPQMETALLNVDPVLMQRAFTNIVCNAIVHNPDETEVYVRVITNKGIRVEIEDNGRGIPEEDCKNLFERYYRGTNTDESSAGTGLGLAIAKQIIEAHGGEIQLESEVGEGTKVGIIFPDKMEYYGV